MDEFKKFLTLIKDDWAKNENEIVRSAALNFDNVQFEVTKISRSQKFDLTSVIGETNSPIAKALLGMSEYLQWMNFPQSNQMSEKVTLCDLIPGQFGTSDKMSLKLIYVPANATLPQHAQLSRVIKQVVAAGKGSKLGLTSHHMEERKVGEILIFEPTMPKVLEGGTENGLLVISYNEVIEDDEFFFADVKAGEEYVKDIMKIDKSDIYSYYINFAKNYEKTMRGWGWFIPDMAVNALIEHGELGDSVDRSTLKVLDLGCGDGLGGKVLTKKGFLGLTGVDFSETMLEKAKEKEFYEKVLKVDLLKTLPFPDNHFDVLLSTGVTTYLEPYVLEYWLQVTKPGGLICFSHKSSIWPKFEVEQEKLAKNGKWRLLWVNPEPVPYLPALENYATKEMTKIYIYKKL